MAADEQVLQELVQVLKVRKGADPERSYVASLYTKGLDAILKKVGEEAIETLIAAKSGDRKQLIYETADLWFHTLVLLTYQGLELEQVLAELKARFGRSGFEEKAARQTKQAEV